MYRKEVSPGDRLSTVKAFNQYVVRLSALFNRICMLAYIEKNIYKTEIFLRLFKEVHSWIYHLMIHNF